MWRYSAYRVNGDGTETLIGSDLPIESPSPTQVLSGPDKFTGTIPVKLSRLDDGSPIFKKHQTAIYAERDGEIIVAGLLTNAAVTGEAHQTLNLECIGWTGFAAGRPYLGDKAWVGITPTEVFWHIWGHIQSWRGSNIGLKVPSIRYGQKLGKAAYEKKTPIIDSKGKTVGVNVEHVAAEPYRLSYYNNQDLGQELDNLANTTPFDYRTDHQWSGDRALHSVILGCPRLGVDRPNLRFVMGENVLPLPDTGDNRERGWTDVMVVGSGDGAKTLWATSSMSNPPHLATWHVIMAKDLNHQDQVTRMASRYLSYRNSEWGISQITVKNTPMAPIGTWDLGDTVEVLGPAEGWADQLKFRGRIMEQAFHPDDDSVTLTLVDPFDH